jgi:beta-xylosidase
MAMSMLAGSALVKPVRALWAGLSCREGEPSQGEWGDQGDGTYVNPVMPGDFSDLDAIRVGDDYYAMSSTFQYSPGVVILHSKDLVNWQIAGHVVADLQRISPELNWDRMNRAGHGIWAGSLRFHAGRFWVYFNTPDEGFFMSMAVQAAGPWEPVTCLWRTTGWDDPCPFWDDDGQAYLVATQYAKDPVNGLPYNIHLFHLSADGRALADRPGRIIHQSRGSEANKLYKIDGVYLHLYSEVRPEGRVVMMNRAKNLAGPWETRQLNHVHTLVDKGPNQGGLIQVPSGAWYFVTHQGKGDWEGRAGVLLPVTWIEGWPVIGAAGTDGMGNMVWCGRKPIAGFPPTRLVANDDFGGETLKPEWEWNYQPRAAMWTLSERPGFLRLRAFRPLRGDTFLSVGNMLTQRCMRTTRCEVTVKVDVGGMADGQEAGLAHYAKSDGRLGVVQAGGVRQVSFSSAGTVVAGPVVSAKTVWLRSTWGFDGMCQFAYSFDGVRFLPMGEAYAMSWGSYRGDRVALYTFQRAGETGYADFGAFAYEVRGSAWKEDREKVQVRRRAS